MPQQAGGTAARRYTSAVQLRPYQQECIDRCLEAFRLGIMRQAVSLPVGSGKTVIFSHLIRSLPPLSPTATQTLVLAHREELLYQAARQIQAANPDLMVEIEQGGRQANLVADVIVASVPTLGRSDGYSEGPAGNWRLEKYEPSRFKCIIIDEAHHASAQTYRRILRHFAADTSDCQIYVWGCSATLRRYDGLGLAGVFDEITYQRPFLSMIKEGWLCGIRVTSIETRTDLNGVRKLGDDLALASLSRAVNNLERNKLIVDAYRKFAQGSRRSTVVFAVNVNHVKALVKAFSDAGIEAATITASTNRNDRVEILRAFSERRIPVLINCGILTEGTDIPAIDCVMMARPTRSPVLFQQMLGRGMRLYPGKADCLVLDFVDTFRPGTDMVTVPTLMGLDPEVLVKDQLFDKQTIKDPDNARCSALSLKDGEQQHNKEDEDGGGYQGLPPAESLLLSSPDQIIARHHRNPYAIFELKQEAGATKALWQPVYLDQLSVGDPRLLRWSRLAWVSPDEDKYLISFNNRTIYIEKNPDKGMYVAYQRFHMVRPVAGSRQGQQAGSASEHQQPAKRGKFVSRPQMLNMEADTARHAVTACDTYLKQILPFHMWRGLHRQSLWRQKPATPGQLKFLKRLRAPIDDSGSDSGGVGADGQGGAGTKDYGEKSGEVPWLTRGVAANLILQLTNGSGQNWRRKLRQGLRIQKQAAEREQQRRSQALWLEGY